MSIPVYEFDIRNSIAEDLQSAIDSTEEIAHPEFLAGIEYATAIVLKAIDARPFDIR